MRLKPPLDTYKRINCDTKHHGVKNKSVLSVMPLCCENTLFSCYSLSLNFLSLVGFLFVLFQNVFGMLLHEIACKIAPEIALNNVKNRLIFRLFVRKIDDTI